MGRGEGGLLLGLVCLRMKWTCQDKCPGKSADHPTMSCPDHLEILRLRQRRGSVLLAVAAVDLVCVD